MTHLCHKPVGGGAEIPQCSSLSCRPLGKRTGLVEWRVRKTGNPWFCAIYNGPGKSELCAARRTYRHVRPGRNIMGRASL